MLCKSGMFVNKLSTSKRKSTNFPPKEISWFPLTLKVCLRTFHLKKYIGLAIEYIRKGNLDLKLSPTELQTLFHFATAETHYLFKGIFYDQVDGVAMGSLFSLAR